MALLAGVRILRVSMRSVSADLKGFLPYLTAESIYFLL
jgi:hypothetical protein